MAQRCFNLSNITRHLLFVIWLLYLFYTNVLEISARLLILSKTLHIIVDFILACLKSQQNFRILVLVSYLVCNNVIYIMLINLIGICLIGIMVD